MKQINIKSEVFSTKPYSYHIYKEQKQNPAPHCNIKGHITTFIHKLIHTPKKTMAIFDPFKLRHKPPSIFPTAVKTGHVFSVVAKFFFTICILISVAMIFSYIIFSGCSDYQSFADYRRFGRDTVIPTTNSSAIVPKNQSSEATDISHIFFGIGGSVQTWRERSRYTELWWQQNNTRGFVWLDEEPPLNMTWLPTYPPYKVSADTSRFNYTCWYKLLLFQLLT